MLPHPITHQLRALKLDGMAQAMIPWFVGERLLPDGSNHYRSALDTLLQALTPESYPIVHCPSIIEENQTIKDHISLDRGRHYVDNANQLALDCLNCTDNMRCNFRSAIFENLHRNTRMLMGKDQYSHLTVILTLGRANHNWDVEKDEQDAYHLMLRALAPGGFFSVECPNSTRKAGQRY